MSEVKKDTFRSFTDDMDGYTLDGITWKIQEVKGNKPKELRNRHRSLEKLNDKMEGIVDSYDLLDKQDEFAKEILEVYLTDFNYDMIVKDYDPKVLREMAVEIFFILSRTGSNMKEISRSIRLYKATQPKQENTQS